MDDPYAELARVKARIAEMERYAAAAPPLHDAIADHYSPARPAKDRKTRDAENAAKFYSPSEEAAFRQREKDPERYDRDLAAMGGDLLAQSIALAGREAHVKLGRALPTPEEE